ncbi:MAG: penicillin acylase family protein [Bdellovibrionales bacterium]|nr:penicillin acylase family protein [Bdellovibrionales bacterium]
MRETFRRFTLFVFWGFLLFALNTHWGSIPPMGSFLNPFQGVWQNGILKKDRDLSFKELKESIFVQIDDHAVPHIFAKNNFDLYFAQGYLHAKDRLFQMDLSARAGSGRLSEIVGNKALDIDKFFISIGMREGARQSANAFLKDPLTNEAVTAYVSGINTYIDSLSFKDYPLEYKLLNAKPEHFTPLHIAQFLMIMSYRLAGKHFDLELTRVLKNYGKEKLYDLFPAYQNDTSLIIDKGEIGRSIASKPNVFTDNFVSSFSEYDSYLNYLAGKPGEPEGFNGSNNWAVHRSKTKKGYNIVANDTHLSFNLPSVWYEMQLTNPETNMYGASFPGAPGIIIGFNQDITWAVTNATMDVMDFYEVEFRNNFSEYQIDGEWLPSKAIVDVIEVKSGKQMEYVTVWTEQGVVVDKKGNKGLVLAWIPHQETTELTSLLKLNRSHSLKDCLKYTKLFLAPSQNFICADKKDISITHNGKMAKKKVYQGSVILDGSKSKNYWHEYIPSEEMPFMLNPKLNFVRSANQMAVDESYKYYLGWYYEDSYRGRRIRDILSQNNKFTVKDMQDLQNDILDYMAMDSLPYMISHLDTSGLSEAQNSLVNQLKSWDYSMSSDSYLPSVYYQWWSRLRDSIWQDQLWDGDRKLVPQATRTIKLLRDLSLGKSKNQVNDLYWVDDIRTIDIKESLKDIATSSFRAMWNHMQKTYGEIGPAWNWEHINVLNIPHVAKIPGLGAKPEKINGSLKTVLANNRGHGPSWKMIVELGPTVEGWTNIPGGVSGNPFDPTYQHWVKGWSQGEMRKAHYWLDLQDKAQVKTIEWKSDL